MVIHIRKRWKRKSGYVNGALCIPKKELTAYDLFCDDWYSDWDDWRDGLRDVYSDFKRILKLPRAWDGFDIRMKRNEKQFMLLRRRKRMKERY